MDVVYSHVCGLNVHKKNVVACVLTPDEKEIRTFSTFDQDLIQMVDWIISKGCTHVAMESTGSFWKPIYNLLEMENLEVLVVNAKQFKNVPESGERADPPGFPACRIRNWPRPSRCTSLISAFCKRRFVVTPPFSVMG